MSAHTPPFYCPYCGEEDIRPFGETHGEWVCAACRRVWTLRYVGLARPGADAVAGAATAAAPAPAAERPAGPGMSGDGAGLPRT